MPRNPSTWAEYRTDEIAATVTGGDVHTIVRVFGSEVAALRSAVATGNRVVRLEFGETVHDAINRAAAPEPQPSRASRPARERVEPEPEKAVE